MSLADLLPSDGTRRCLDTIPDEGVAPSRRGRSLVEWQNALLGLIPFTIIALAIWRSRPRADGTARQWASLWWKPMIPEDGWRVLEVFGFGQPQQSATTRSCLERAMPANNVRLCNTS
jgi:hypothetical protein